MYWYIVYPLTSVKSTAGYEIGKDTDTVLKARLSNKCENFIKVWDLWEVLTDNHEVAYSNNR